MSEAFHTIEPDHEHGDVDVYEHGEYEPWSVLAGQPRRSFRGSFPTVEAALAEYPGAEVLGHRTTSVARVPDLPPADFDPADAGETWSEDY